MAQTPDLPIGALVWAPVPVMAGDFRKRGVTVGGRSENTRTMKVLYQRACMGRIEDYSGTTGYTVRVATDHVVFCRRHELILIALSGPAPTHLTEAQMIP
jgi:hypothetical protein